MPEDDDKLTMPEIFSYPASPHLATQIDGREIDFAKIEAATAQLAAKYDAVLLEGAGGLMVPLTTDLLTIDYIEQKQYPVILVSSGRLGSINHTLLSLEALKTRGLNLHALAYNLNDESQDPLISQDTAKYLKNYLANPTNLHQENLQSKNTNLIMNKNQRDLKMCLEKCTTWLDTQ